MVPAIRASEALAIWSWVSGPTRSQSTTGRNSGLAAIERMKCHRRSSSTST